MLGELVMLALEMVAASRNWRLVFVVFGAFALLVIAALVWAATQ